MADVYRPASAADAVAFLDDHPEAMPVAGGTDLVIDCRLGRVDPAWLVDLTSIGGLSGIHWDGDRLVLGALTTVRALELDAVIAARAGALTDAARVLGSVQIRNMATVGGNLCHATPSAELAPPLLVHDAVAHVAGPHGDRDLDVAALFAAPGQNSLARGEVLTSLTCEVPGASGSCYLRQTIRWSMDLAGVGVAAFVDRRDGQVVQARIALGAVSPVPMRVPEAESLVADQEWSDDRATEAGRIAAAASLPISDARGPAAYRRAVVAALVPRALRTAWERAQS